MNFHLLNNQTYGKEVITFEDLHFPEECDTSFLSAEEKQILVDAEEGATLAPLHKKQNKNIDDRKMLKVGIDIMNKDFSVQIGYNRKAVKTYTDVQVAPQQQNSQENSS